MAQKKWSIVVIIDGHTLKASGDGTEEGTLFEGREEDIQMAKALIWRGFNVPLANERFGPWVTASYETAIGLTAALVNAGPSEGVLWRAPKEVLEFIENYESEHNYEKALYGKKDN